MKNEYQRFKIEMMKDLDYFQTKRRGDESYSRFIEEMEETKFYESSDDLFTHYSENIHYFMGSDNEEEKEEIKDLVTKANRRKSVTLKTMKTMNEKMKVNNKNNENFLLKQNQFIKKTEKQHKQNDQENQSQYYCPIISEFIDFKFLKELKKQKPIILFFHPIGTVRFTIDMLHSLITIYIAFSIPMICEFLG